MEADRAVGIDNHIRSITPDFDDYSGIPTKQPSLISVQPRTRPDCAPGTLGDQHLGWTEIFVLQRLDGFGDVSLAENLSAHFQALLEGFAELLIIRHDRCKLTFDSCRETKWYIGGLEIRM